MKRLFFLLAMAVLCRLAATLLAMRLSLNSTQPSVKLDELLPAFFFFRFTQWSRKESQKGLYEKFFTGFFDE